MSGRVTLLGVDEVGELGRVTQEENGRIIRDHVPVTLLCSEFDRETAGVAGTYKDDESVVLSDMWRGKIIGRK